MCGARVTLLQDFHGEEGGHDMLPSPLQLLPLQDGVDFLLDHHYQVRYIMPCMCMPTVNDEASRWVGIGQVAALR